MENIIAQQLVGLQEKILKKIAEDGLEHIGETAEALFEILKSGTCDMLRAIIEGTDNAIAKARAERKAVGLTVKQRDVKRRLTTSLGDIEYRRTYYETTEEENKRIYLIDYLIGVEPYERVSKELCAKLVNLSSEMSYGKSVERGDAKVSRQTVCNKVYSLHEVVQDIKRAEHTPEELHIFADEDHVHMKNGKNAIVPLVTISEGIDASNSKRHRIINPLHIGGYGMDTEIFDDQVEACVNERYDINTVKKIYIHGDGASRIAKLSNHFPNASHVLDEFHLEKYLKKLRHYEKDFKRIKAIRTALKDGNWEKCKELFEKIYSAQEDSEKEECRKVIHYLWNNREAAYLRLTANICGSCTESLVSHVLSERLSRTPLAWSEDGLKNMAMLVVYHKNGRKVTAEDINVSLIPADRKKRKKSEWEGWSKYKGYMDRQIDSILDFDWTHVFEHQSVSFGKVEPSFLIRKSFGKLAPAI